MRLIENKMRGSYCVFTGVNLRFRKEDTLTHHGLREAQPGMILPNSLEVLSKKYTPP